MKILSREILLLSKVAELLNRQHESYYVLNLLDEIIVYDGVECDGQCLLEDINILLEEREF